MKSTKQRAVCFFGSISVLGLLSLPLAGVAATEEVPQSRCITATTQAMYASMLAQEKKDVAPYVDKEGMNAAIEVYKQNIVTAWSAMGDAYCGYGDFGAKSAIHSFQKTAERVRSAFLDRAAQFRKTGNVNVAAPVVTPPPVTIEVTTPVPVPVAAAPTPIVKEIAKSAKLSGAIARGLHEGLRGEDVLRLQKLLATIQKISMDDPYITGYFGAMTKKRLIKFQMDQGIVHSEDAPGAGQVGPRTAAALNKLK